MEEHNLFLYALSREAVAAPSLEVSKARLDRAWSNLGWWKVSLPMAGGGTGWAVMSLQPKSSCDVTIAVRGAGRD